MDHKRKGSKDRNREYPDVMIPFEIPSSPSSSTGVKCCEICSTTKTPLWRGGPSGPKSVCNACGIKYRKKRRELSGINSGVEKTKKENKHVMRLLGFATNFLLPERSMLRLKQRRRLAEEEEAAVLLMALSSGLLYA